MASVIQYYEGIGSVVVIGNYSPRQCGIATFTTDLVEALSTEAPEINLRTVTTSREELNKEIIERKKAEQELEKKQGREM